MSSSNKMLITLVGLSAMIFAFQKCNNKVIENFEGLQNRRVRVDRVIQGPSKGDFVTVAGTYQAMLNPDSASGMVDYGAFIRYDPPAAQNMRGGAVNYAGMVGGNTHEGYCGGGACNSAGCRAGGTNDTSVQKSSNLGLGNVKTSNLVSSNYSGGNYQQQVGKLQYNETTDMLPVQSMGGGIAVDVLGQATTQPIIYDRYVYANQKSRLAAQGDPIRGDPPVMPLAKGWFSPNVNPNIDLRTGALAAMGGVDNDTSKELLALQSAASGGLLDVGAGVNYGVQKSSFASGAGGDIRVTAFP